MVLPDSDGIARVPPYSGSVQAYASFRLQDCYLLWWAVPDRFTYETSAYMDVLQPQGASPLVWANPRSLAATDGITVVFFSSRYLDVSVPWVCLPSPMDSVMDT